MSSANREYRDRFFTQNRKNENMDTQKEIRDWIAKKLADEGRGAKSRLAEATGLRKDAITRILNTAPDKEIRAIKADELAKIADYFGEQPPVFLDEGLKKSNKAVNLIPVIGKVAANSWMAVDDMDFGFDDIEYVPSAGGYAVQDQFALIVDGNCLNKIASNGDQLVCVNIIKAGIDIEPNDLVVVERSRFNGQMVERTAKRIRQTADGYELWPESNDPNHQEPIKLTQAVEGEEVRIVGKVLWILRKP